MPLVLTRKEKESIRIGDSVTVTVARIGARNVRIVIDAPPEISVHRGELMGELPGAIRAMRAEWAAKRAAGGVDGEERVSES